MHMKIGIDRMYILREVKRFFDAIESGRTFEFGKKFTFNPMLHGFSEEDENVFSILKEIYEIEKKMYWQSPKVFFNERYVNLTYGYLKKIAAALGQRKFRMTLPHIEIVSFETRERPFSVAVGKEGDGISVKATGDIGLPLDRDCRLVYKDKKIYVLDTDDPAFPIVKGIFLKYGEELRFEGENHRKFISLIDQFENDNFLEISPDLKDAVVKKPLKLSIKIEGYKNGIAADVKFVYGEKIIDPFAEAVDDLILRDYEKEDYVLKLFRDSGFELDRGRLVLIDEEKLYTFIKDVAHRLAGMGEVYYSSDVKHLFSTKAPKIRTSVRSLAGNLLEIRMDMEGIDEKTAEEILRAIKEKKKYFRLKDGSDFNSGKGQAFLLSLKAGGVGLNLTSADTVIHFDPWWNPAVEEQAADRAYRIGQENNVQVFRFITRGTIEEKIDELQKRKKDLISSIVSEGEVFINALSKDEIMELFRVG
ncbi:SNF2 helicase associated domain-containing protein [Caldanaerovirga acetigignens]